MSAQDNAARESELQNIFTSTSESGSEQSMIGRILDRFKANQISKEEAERQISWVGRCDRSPRLAAIFAEATDREPS